MKQILFTGTGAVEVCDVPVPAPLPRSILVQTVYSLISTGTESAALSTYGGWRGALEKARKRPERLLQAWRLARSVGIRQAAEVVQQRLSDYLVPGYSSVGRVVEASSDDLNVKPGDYVACVGAGIAVHAEFVSVPENLYVVLPDGADLRQASFGALLCVAMHGIRRLDLSPGETVAVVGLGLIGQITLRLLAAMGYLPMGFDVRADRARKARSSGFPASWALSEVDAAEICRAMTGGHGVDGVILTAATPSDEPVNLAFDLCRRGGRVSLVGDVGLRLERPRMYKKEIELRMSCSYGPGRYDDQYELEGRDYPYSYVRWTERRNLEYAMKLIRDGRVDLSDLVTHIFPVDDAKRAYSVARAAESDTYGILFDYGVHGTNNVPAKSQSRRIVLSSPPKREQGGRIRIGVIGTGNFCKTVHLPNLEVLKEQFEIAALVSRTGSSAVSSAKRYGVPIITTDYREVLEDDSVDAVMITTRHASHARLVIEALDCGKHVFVEKPMCLSEEEGEAIVERVQRSGLIVQVGFNRRYAPMMSALREAVGTVGPRLFTCRVNVGPLGDTWSNSPEEGGRLLGEGVHFFDLCNWFMGAEPCSVHATSVGHPGVTNPNVTVTLSYPDGSVAQVVYTTLGNSSAGKEYYEAVGNGRLVICEDFVRFRAYGSSARPPRSARRDKGLREQLVAFAAAVRGQPHPVERPDERAGLLATRIALQASR